MSKNCSGRVLCFHSSNGVHLIFPVHERLANDRFFHGLLMSNEHRFSRARCINTSATLQPELSQLQTSFDTYYYFVNKINDML